jgi:hypothetical protein
MLYICIFSNKVDLIQVICVSHNCLPFQSLPHLSFIRTTESASLFHGLMTKSIKTFVGRSIFWAKAYEVLSAEESKCRMAAKNF